MNNTQFQDNHNNYPNNENNYLSHPKKNSILGILSFISSIFICISGFLLLIYIISVCDYATSGQLSLVGLWIFAIYGHAFVGGLMGLISLFFKDTKKLFGILGLILHAVTGCIWLFIVLLGLVVS